eukprot:990947-Rhodomonas_salina.2
MNHVCDAPLAQSTVHQPGIHPLGCLCTPLRAVDSAKSCEHDRSGAFSIVSRKSYLKLSSRLNTDEPKKK